MPRQTKATITKARAKSAAKTLADLIEAERITGWPLRIGVAEPQSSTSGGYFVQIATLGKGRPTISVFLDKWLDGKTPVFWAGFDSDHRDKQNLVQDLISEGSRFPNVATLREYSKVRPGTYKMNSSPNIDKLSRPFAEFYDVWAGFGVYSDPSKPFDAGRSAYFILSVLKELPEFQVDAINDIEIGADYPDLARSVVIRFARDPRIRKQVKARAKGKCEFCGKPGFKCWNGTPYLECHHIIALANDGADKMHNVIALCPRDHREAHVGERRDDIEKEMIVKVAAAEKERLRR